MEAPQAIMFFPEMENNKEQIGPVEIRNPRVTSPVIVNGVNNWTLEGIFQFIPHSVLDRIQKCGHQVEVKAELFFNYGGSHDIKIIAFKLGLREPGDKNTPDKIPFTFTFVSHRHHGRK